MNNKKFQLTMALFKPDLTVNLKSVQVNPLLIYKQNKNPN